MPCRPVGRFPLQHATRTLAVVNMMLCALGLIMCFVATLRLGGQKALIETGYMLRTKMGEVDFGAVLIAFLAILLCFKLMLAMILYYGAKEANYHRCEMWYLAAMFCWTLHLMIFAIIIAGIATELWLVITLVVELTFEVYLIYVVYALMKEIEHHSRPDDTQNADHLALIDATNYL